MRERKIDQTVIELKRHAAEINEVAIAEGLMLPDGQSYRKDYNPLLGKDLSEMERVYYAVICSCPEASLASDIYTKVYRDFEVTSNDRYLVFVTIPRIRKKLGESAIITKRHHGYVSRRTLIENKIKPPLEIF